MFADHYDLFFHKLRILTLSYLVCRHKNDGAYIWRFETRRKKFIRLAYRFLVFGYEIVENYEYE